MNLKRLIIILKTSNVNYINKNRDKTMILAYTYVFRNLALITKEIVAEMSK